MAKKKDERKGRPDGLKRVSFTINGKRYYCYGHTLKEARDRVPERKKEIEEKRFKPSKDLTVSQYHERWAEAREGTVKGATIRKQKFQFKAAANCVIDDAGTTFGQIPLANVETQHIRILQKRLQSKAGGKSRSTNTVNSIVAHVSHVFHDAVIERAISWNPCTGVKNLKRTEKPARDTIHRALTKEETTAFFKAAADSTYYNLYCFLINSGCRVGEAAALTISDVKKDHIQISKTVTKNVDGGYEIGDTPKTAHGKRTIPLTAPIRDAINRQKDINAALFGSKVIRLDSPIFTTGWGNILIAANVDRDIQRYCTAAGVEKFTAHALRATFATRAIESGMNPKTLQEILGHADIGVTMNTYAHALDSTKAEEMNKVIALAAGG